MEVKSLKSIGITLGDPSGIGPEVIKAALNSNKLPQDFNYVIFGSSVGFEPGKPSHESALQAMHALEEAVAAAKRGDIAALVTGPICKSAMHEIGFDFPGQTEFLADRFSIKNFAMCLTGGKITVALVTTHVPLYNVSQLLSTEDIIRVGCLLANFLVSRGYKTPNIAIAGLNPHAGEKGDIGSEEIEIIEPAVRYLKLKHHNIGNFSGPHSPDTLFYHMVEGRFDGAVCMYHDQGLIPLKLHAFDKGVNVTLGLPFLRTSPDHGTAFDIAGKGIASHYSMIEAIRLACQLA